MGKMILGIHHITVVSSDAQKLVNFYAGILGLRLVKKTINFDASQVYHLYFGNTFGLPGSIITFFPYSGLVNGKACNGNITEIAFSIPSDSLDFWVKRFSKYNVIVSDFSERFNEKYVTINDPDGLRIELIATANDEREAYDGFVPKKHGIRGFHSATLQEGKLEGTQQMLVNTLDHVLIAKDVNRFRFSCKNGELGSIIDVVVNEEGKHGLSGSGVTHHIAFAIDSIESQEVIRARVNEMKIYVTPLKDRKYFKSIYFRETGGVLFEVATMQPGFSVDEPFNSLGMQLMLPEWFEEDRIQIEGNLPFLTPPIF